ncbi:MAG: restriction endonuclease subunit S [Lachnospiraceae bacterium]
MEFIKLKNINKYKSESINPAKMPDTIFEMYSVPIYETGHPEYLRGDEIASNKAVVKKNDILLCKINPRINRVWIVSDESDKMNIASSEWIVIRTETYNPEFLAWYFRSPKFQKLMTSEVTGIGGSLTRAQPKRVAEYPVPVLDRRRQDEIVEVLNKCKFVIDSRKQELQKLDDLIKARFVEMFYDKGYPVLKWNDVFYTTTGKLDSNAAVEDGEYPFFTCSKEALRIDKFAFDQEALLLAGNNAAGKYDVKYYKGKFNAYQRTYVLGLKEDWSYQLFRYQLEDKLVYLQQQSLGGLTKYLTRKILEELDFVIPPLDKQIEFDSFVKQVDKSKVAIQKSLDETQLLFDSLMQQYFG